MNINKLIERKNKINYYLYEMKTFATYINNKEKRKFDKRYLKDCKKAVKWFYKKYIEIV